MKSLASLLAGTALMFSANAATVSYNFTNPLVATEIHQSGNLGLFDTSLGTLTGVSMTFTGNELLGVTFSPGSGATGNYSADIGIGFNFASSLGALDALLVGANPFISLTTTFSGNSSGVTFLGTSSSGTSTLTSELTGIELNFENAGGGNFSVSCSSVSSFSLSSSVSVNTSSNNKADCGVSIQYTYTPQVIDPPVSVPEPTSLALVSFALAGLLASRRGKI